MTMLETARLRLRLLHEEVDGDAALYVHLYTDAAVMQWIAPPLGVDAATAAFNRACRHNHAARPGHRTWRIDGRDGGDIGIAALQRHGDAAEIGVVLREGAWRHGLAREALGGVLVHAFDHMGLALVYGERPDDAQAKRVDRMFAPLGLHRVPAPVPGQARWELPRARWAGPRVA
jgi:RimJ/RimL family protein N-acetyltransferase